MAAMKLAYEVKLTWWDRAVIKFFCKPAGNFHLIWN